MRGCLGFIVVLAATLGLLAFLVARFLVPTLVDVALTSSPALRGQDVSVQVDTSMEGVFLHRSVDRITITGHGLHVDGAAIADAAVTLDDVSIIDRSFATIAGTLSGTDVADTHGLTVHLDAVRLSGSSSGIVAVGVVTPAELTSTIEGELRAAGIPIDSVALHAGRIELTVAGHTVETQLAVTAAGLVLEAPVGLLGATVVPEITLLPATADQGWRIVSVNVTARAVEITADVDRLPGG